MIRPNGHGENRDAEAATGSERTEFFTDTAVTSPSLGLLPEPATRAKQRAKQQIQQNRSVIIAAGAIIVALLVFVMVSMPRQSVSSKAKAHSFATENRSTMEGTQRVDDKSLFPIVDSGMPVPKETHDGFVSERDLQRTAARSMAKPSPGVQVGASGTLGSIAPLGEVQTWQAPPYQVSVDRTNDSEAGDATKSERDTLDKPSLVYARNLSPNSRVSEALNNEAPDLGLGLAVGTRLRARLESAASTAVQTPILAVIEYNYEQNGEIIVPAGAKAVGHIKDADRSGYVGIQFDSLLFPDGASVAIDAAATDLNLLPLKGRVEGKNTGKSVLVRSLSGIGAAGALLMGRRGFDQPLSESDLLRQRLSNNIGQAGDEEVSRLAITQRIVVTISADTPIYVVLERSPKLNQAAGQSSVRAATPSSPSIEQVRQLLQLQQELGQTATSSQGAK